MIERACTPEERELFEPSVESLRRAIRAVDRLAHTLEPRMQSEALQFDPYRYVWLRAPEPEASVRGPVVGEPPEV